jgi:hypothetical protein
MSVSSSFTRAPPVTWASSPLERALIARIAVRSGVPDCAATSRSFDRVLQRIANEPRIPLVRVLLFYSLTFKTCLL